MTTDLDHHVTKLTTAGVDRAYKLGSVPESPAYPYAVLSLDAGRPNARGLDMEAGKVYELAVQCFGRTQDAVRDVARLADDAFDGEALTDITGSPVAVRELATRPFRDPDDQGVLNILHVYHY